MEKPKETEVKYLTPEQEKKVWEAICIAKQDDDRDPEVVIEESYNGNRMLYLLHMARWHNVKLD